MNRISKITKNLWTHKLFLSVLDIMHRIAARQVIYSLTFNQNTTNSIENELHTEKMHILSIPVRIGPS